MIKLLQQYSSQNCEIETQFQYQTLQQKEQDVPPLQQKDQDLHPLIEDLNSKQQQQSEVEQQIQQLNYEQWKEVEQQTQQLNLQEVEQQNNVLQQEVQQSIQQLDQQQSIQQLDQQQQQQQQEQEIEQEDYDMNLFYEYEEDLFGLCEICCLNLFLIERKCGHNYCYDCVRQYLEVEVNRGQVDLKCPQIGCEDLLESCLVTKVLNLKSEYSKIDFINQYMFSCYTCSHINVLEKKNKEEFKCEKCKTRYDSETRRITERSLIEIEQLKLMRQAGMVECPKCIKWIEKVEGCDHITCQCSHQFCYKCAKSWNQHGQCLGVQIEKLNGHLSTD